MWASGSPAQMWSFSHTLAQQPQSLISCYIQKSAGRCGFRIMGVAPWEWMRLWICTQFYFNQSARKSAGRPINSASYFIRLTYRRRIYFTFPRSRGTTAAERLWLLLRHRTEDIILMSFPNIIILSYTSLSRLLCITNGDTEYMSVS